MSAKTFALAALMLAVPQSGNAQLTGRQTASGCLSVQGVSDDPAIVTAEGRLSLRTFAGPPSYESVAAGDAEERTFILELPHDVCIEDGGSFADPAERFATVQVSTDDEELLAFLNESVGLQVEVIGEGFAAHTGHHHAPLVILANRVTVY